MNLSGKSLLEVLTDLGFEDQGLRGNHFVLKKGSATVLVPDEDELAEKTVISLIDQAGLSSRDVLKLLKLQREGVSLPSLGRDDRVSSGAGSGPVSRAWNARVWAPPLAVYRILIGVMFLISALEKAPWLTPAFGWFQPFLEAASQSPTFPFMKGLVDSILLPNVMALGWLQYIVEGLIGVFLVLGLFTVLTSFIGAAWVLFFSLLALGLPTQWVWSYIMWTASMILFFTMRAGRSFGLDQAIARKAAERKEESGFWRFVGWLV